MSATGPVVTPSLVDTGPVSLVEALVSPCVSPSEPPPVGTSPVEFPLVVGPVELPSVTPTPPLLPPPLEPALLPPLSPQPARPVPRAIHAATPTQAIHPSRIPARDHISPRRESPHSPARRPRPPALSHAPIPARPRAAGPEALDALALLHALLGAQPFDLSLLAQRDVAADRLELDQAAVPQARGWAG
jgi:hypothetical protein